MEQAFIPTSIYALVGAFCITLYFSIVTRWQVLTANAGNMQHAAHTCCSMHAVSKLSVERRFKQPCLYARSRRRTPCLQLPPALPWTTVTAQLVQPTASAHLPALLTSIAVLVISTAAAVFLIAAIPTLWAVARTAHRMEAVLKVNVMVLHDGTASVLSPVCVVCQQLHILPPTVHIATTCTHCSHGLIGCLHSGL